MPPEPKIQASCDHIEQLSCQNSHLTHMYMGSHLTYVCVIITFKNIDNLKMFINSVKVDFHFSVTMVGIST